jgi:hypothetical protein
MVPGSFFIQRPEDALRHVQQLAKGLKKIATAGWIGGASCTLLAALVSHFLVTGGTNPNPLPGSREISGITLVTWFMAVALLVFSSLYYVSGWGLERQKSWARIFAVGTFLAKVLLCVWLGRGSFSAMFVVLVIAIWDFYGLWVLLSKETAQLFASSNTARASVKPANLTT